MTRQIPDSSGGGTGIDLPTTQPQTDTRECENCGEEYEELLILNKVTPNLCPDCRGDWDGVNLGTTSLVVCADSRPLMENGPLSLSLGDEVGGSP